MTVWQREPRERITAFSPIGLRLVDDMTNGAPIGGVRAVLDRQGPVATAWMATGVTAVRTSGGVVVYPGLGRTSLPVGEPAVSYRVRLEADFYIPAYRAQSEGIPFSAFPYNDTTDPQQFAKLPVEARLAPAPNYPFPSHIPVLRGTITDAADNRIPDVLVFWTLSTTTFRAITQADGVFALPLPLAPLNTATAIHAIDQRTGRSKDQQITLPHDLTKSWTLIIS